MERGVGDESQVQELIDQGHTDWNNGFRGACQGGHLALVQEMLRRGATSPFLTEFMEACLEGRRLVAEFLLDQGMGETVIAFRLACRKGNLAWAFDLCSRMLPDELDACLGEASETGHWPLIHALIDQGATDWDGGLYGACRSGRKDVFADMLQRGATDLAGGCLRAVCIYGQPAMLGEILQRGVPIDGDAALDLAIWGFTCLHPDAQRFMPLVATLLYRGASLAGKSGEMLFTSIHFTDECVELLLKAGVSGDLLPADRVDRVLPPLLAQKREKYLPILQALDVLCSDLCELIVHYAPL